MERKIITYVAMVRAINVSGHKIINMGELRDMCEKMGLQNVQTYIQSGNIVFQHLDTLNSILEKIIAEGIKRRFSFDVPVIVKEVSELRRVVKKNPYVSKGIDKQNRIFVVFPANVPYGIKADNITQFKYDDDEFVIFEDVVYLYCPVSYGDSQLSNSFFEKKLKLVSTTRNWHTINELIKIGEKIHKNKNK